MMRILALTNLYPNPFQPHRAPFNRHQFRILAEKHPVRVIAPVAWTDEWRARRSGLPRLPHSRQATQDGLQMVHPRYLFPPKFGRQWHGTCYQWSVRRAFWRAVAEFEPGIVFAPWAYPDGWAAVRLAKSAGLPVVIQVHGSDVLLLDRFPARSRRTIEALCGADGVIAVSEDLARRVVALGVDPSRVKMIHDGVDRSVFHPGSKTAARQKLGLKLDEPMLLFVGNLLPVKGLDVLLNALHELARRGLSPLVILIGAGPMRSALERQAKALGLENQVRFMGALPQAELPDWYRAADVFVLPSRSEGVPNVLLEASACGTPWLASRVGGIPEITRLGAGRLVPPEQAQDLASALREVLEQPPPVPATGPRDRHEAVAELAEFLQAVIDRRIASQPRVFTPA
jgi:glycosyltransferase involved in cell wall biosynthesis